MMSSHPPGPVGGDLDVGIVSDRPVTVQHDLKK
jgi:hypothetical protein